MARAVDDEDNQHFLKVIAQCREISGFILHAYCLMGNHIHLLIQTDNEPLELVMKRIGTRYVVWYNSKYSRVGHLFQDRFKSEPVENDAYFLKALRYILNNPVHAGLCDKAENYPWSSAADYYRGGGITDTSFAEKMLGHQGLMEYLTAKNDDQCMDDRPARINDQEAQRIIQRIVGAEDVSVCLKEICAHPDRNIRMLRNAGLSIRQISRITGLSIAIVRKF